MTRFLTIITLLAGLCLATSCSKNDDVVTPETLEVNYINMAGNWKLTDWSGESLADEAYFYITFTRKEHTFTIHERLETMYDRLSTGTYALTTNAETGQTTLSGIYDYGRGEWGSDYVVTVLTQDKLVLQSTSDASNVRTFSRIEFLPEF